MPTQSSGPISFADINTALGTGTPLSFNQLYRGGSFVPNITPNSDIPTSGAINMQEMYNTWGTKTKSFTMTVGSTGGKSGKGYLYGFGLMGASPGQFGSLSSRTFLTANGTMTIDGLYYSTTTHAWHLHLSSSSLPPNTDVTYVSLSVSGYFNKFRSAASSTQVAGLTRRWNWTMPPGSTYPASGTVACTINYYG